MTYGWDSDVSLIGLRAPAVKRFRGQVMGTIDARAGVCVCVRVCVVLV